MGRTGAADGGDVRCIPAPVRPTRDRRRHPVIGWPQRGRLPEVIRSSGQAHALVEGPHATTGARCVVASAPWSHDGSNSWPFIRGRSILHASRWGRCGCISSCCLRSCLRTAATCRRARNTRSRRWASTASSGAAGSRCDALRVAIRSARAVSTRCRCAGIAGAGRSPDRGSPGPRPMSGMTLRGTHGGRVRPARVGANRAGRER